MEFEHILVERAGPFTTITMNRPHRRNALSEAHMRELIDGFAGWAAATRPDHPGRRRACVQRRA